MRPFSNKKKKPVITSTPTKPVVVQPNVKDISEDKAFAIQFWDNEWLREIQKRSDFIGSFTTEWQFHYHALNGFVHVDDEILIISIPLLAYNYIQIVTGGNIKFEFNDLSTAATKTQDEALKKGHEFKKTELYKKIIEFFPDIRWELSQYNSIHTHPGKGIQQFTIENDISYIEENDIEGLSTFSSTDLRKTTPYGVVYPFKTGSWISTFAGLMQQRNTLSEMVYNEFRLFNDEKGIPTYYEGTCVTYVKDEDILLKKAGKLGQMFGHNDQIKNSRNYVVLNDQAPSFVAPFKELFDIFLQTNWEIEYNISKEVFKKPAPSQPYQYGFGSNSVHSDLYEMYMDDVTPKTTYYGNRGCDFSTKNTFWYGLPDKDLKTLAKITGVTVIANRPAIIRSIVNKYPQLEYNKKRNFLLSLLKIFGITDESVSQVTKLINMSLDTLCELVKDEVAID